VEEWEEWGEIMSPKASTTMRLWAPQVFVGSKLWWRLEQAFTESALGYGPVPKKYEERVMSWTIGYSVVNDLNQIDDAR